MSSVQFPKITAAEVSNYVVCPESWRLQREHRVSVEPSERQVEARQRRAAWEEQQSLLLRLGGYARIAYCSLFLLAIVVFLLEHQRIRHPNPPSQPSSQSQQQASTQQQSQRSSHVATVPDELALLMVVLGSIIFLWDLFERRGAGIRKDLGVNTKTEFVSVDTSGDAGGENDLFSRKNNISSRPNALLREEGHLIPMDIHPTTDKVRDRHVVALLMHLAILEERDGKSAPYGVLIMGKAQRRTQIRNTPEKQRWLWSLIEEMRSILGGVPTVPTPAPFKCKNCRVRQYCAFSAFTPEKGQTAPPEPS